MRTNPRASVAVLAAAVLLSTGLLAGYIRDQPAAEQSAGPTGPPPTPMSPSAPKGSEAALPLAPEFPPDTPWLQSEPLKLSDLRGRVVVVHFWTFGCINCIHNYPVYKAWQEKYAADKVTIIGVHTPEFSSEADGARVRAKARDNGLKFPIVIDNEQRIWKSWNNHYWPSIYLIDKKGRARYSWEGELHLQTAEGRDFASRIDELLAEKP